LLNQADVLVAEDEPIIGLDLGFAIEDAGGKVIGPASTVEHALTLLGSHSVAGAILDVNLIDGDISPVVECLIERRVPFILQSGVGLPPKLVARFPDLTVQIKPIRAVRLIEELAALIVERQRLILRGPG
jgi:DNA-binding NtrC family response regulator